MGMPNPASLGLSGKYRVMFYADAPQPAPVRFVGGQQNYMQQNINSIHAAWANLERELKDAASEKRGWKAAAARARKETFVLEKLLKEFRKVSCAEANG